MTVQQVWTYGKENGEDTYSFCCGGADYLEGSENMMFVPGHNADKRIIEVDYDTKNVVWDVGFSSEGYLHRAIRIAEDDIYPE